MAPKKSDELDEIRRSLNSLSADIGEMAKQLTTLVELVEEVKLLRMAVKEKDKKISDLEKRVDDLEQYSRMDDLLISGLETKHQSYARALTTAEGGGEDQATPNEQGSLENQVLRFMEGQNMNLNAAMISACHTLPRRDGNTKPLIVMRFVNRKVKMDLLSQGRKLRGTNVYLNEHLTKKNADIARQARILKKQNKLQATWTRNCKVWIKLNGASPEQAKAIMVREIHELDKYR